VIGEVVASRYRVLERLGEGGHGYVHRAEDLRGGPPVAIKLMHSQELSSAELDRFEREAELARRLRHPNVARLVGWGVHAGNVPYLVFELSEGQSLSSLLKRAGVLPQERVARIATQVLRGLAEAHSVGVVHRDIKPANIMVSDGGPAGEQIKIVDFGVAKSLRTNTRVITQSGEVPGTPSYMSPEHVESQQVAPCTDLFSLGLVMAEALTGKKVYGGGAIDVCLDLVSADPVPLPPEVLSSSLGPAIVRATQKNMAARYASAAEMLRDIEAAGAQSRAGVFVPMSNPALSQSSPGLHAPHGVFVPGSNPALSQSSPGLHAPHGVFVPGSNPALSQSSPGLQAPHGVFVPGSTPALSQSYPALPSSGVYVPVSSPPLTSSSPSLPAISQQLAPSQPRPARGIALAVLATVAVVLFAALVIALIVLFQSG